MSKNARSTTKKSYDGPLLLGMTVMLFFLVGFFSPLLSHFHRAEAFSPSGCEGDCTKCHSLSAQDLKEILQKMKFPEVEILGARISPIKGLWEVSFDNKGKRGLFYVDFSKTYILSGSIIEIKSGTNKTQEEMRKLQENKRIEFSRIPLNNALVMGNSEAPFKVAVFTDPDCPYCATLHHEIQKVLTEKRDVVFYIILFPLPMHKDAYWKSRSIICERSLKMLEDSFAHKEIPRKECDAKEIDDNIKLAQDLGVSGTPTIVFPDGRVHSGFLTAQQLVEVLFGKK